MTKKYMEREPIIGLNGILAVETTQKAIHIKNFGPDETENLFTPPPLRGVHIVARFRNCPRSIKIIIENLRVYWNQDASKVTVRSFDFDITEFFNEFDDMPVRFEIHGEMKF